MRITGTAACLAGILFVLVACSPPAPEPIQPEPVYDKYGNAILSGGGGQSCRGGGDRYSPNDARAALPICSGSCGNGLTLSADRQQCVPYRRDGDQPGGSDRGNNGNQQGNTQGAGKN